jgi:hypothetical protein
MQLQREYHAFNRPVRAHETLHALSIRFTVAFRRYPKLMEGLTDYFTDVVARAAWSIEPDSASAYAPYLRFAAAIMAKIGEARAKQLFFAVEGDLLVELRAALSGDPGLLDRAYDLLDQGKIDEAIALLRDAPNQ